MVKTRDALVLASALGRCVGIADDNDFIGDIGEPSFDWMEPGFFEGLSLRAINRSEHPDFLACGFCFQRCLTVGLRRHSCWLATLCSFPNLGLAHESYCSSN
ncbi:hypothetical protein SAMN05192589_115101 [Paracidovorax valerianellae]|uniref:Uncharacterized protein n=1 Tax=Paracidovorax valerianellae TaxID=187868 RepID=A0A1G7C661_9BURK|nr:hypothetical protein SAMN05192589_115101 [Paracidovorax valerianellae]